MKKNYGITRNARGTMSVSILRLFVCSQTIYIYIYIFNSPFIELKFTKCQSIRLRCPVFFLFFKKKSVLHFIVAYIYVSTPTLRLSYVFTDYILKACSYEMCAFLNI